MCIFNLLKRSCLTATLKFSLGVALISPLTFVEAAVAPLTVSGNKVLIGGQQGSLAGNSFFWSNTGWGNEKYYNAQVVAWLKNDWKSTLVRAAMGADDAGGYLSDPANKTRVIAVADAAIANDMYVLIDWHSHHAERHQAQAIAFFREMATKYGNTNNVIYEIYNEPLQVSWSGVIKPYAQAVIAAIRAIDPDNLIVVGTPSWSQDVDVAANDPITGYANIAYTLHFYAGTHKQPLRDKAQVALNKGIALFVTEWGTVNADGAGGVANSETTAWMDFLRTNKISHANWALNDKAEGASSLVPGASASGGWVSSQLTASGALAKSIMLSWQPVTGSLPSGFYQIVNKHNNKCVDVAGVSTANGAAATMWDCISTAQNQQWQFVATDSGFYRLMVRHSNKALNVNGVSAANGALFSQWDWVGGHNQQWKAVDVGGGYYKFIGRQSGRAMDVPGCSTANGTQLNQWDDFNNACQAFRLVAR